MLIEESKITSKGQVTIPKSFRELYGLHEGSRIVFKEDAGTIRMEMRTKEPMKALESMRKDVRFTRDEIDRMKKESKKGWDRDLSR